MDDIMSLCKRRGFIYQASEIYGGINGFWDYGPLGTMLKRNLREAWWQDVVMRPCWGRPGPSDRPVEIVSVDTCIIQNPKVWEASGHVAGFNDPMVDDKETKQRFRADHLHGLFYGERPSDADRAASLERFARRYRRSVKGLVLPSSEASYAIPIATVIATNVSEAISIVERQAKILFRGITLDGGFEMCDEPGVHVESPTAIAPCHDDQGPGWLSIEPVAMETLRKVPESVPSPFTGKPGSLTEPRLFNLMYFTYNGAVFDEANKVYLRPETAQGIFVNFKNVCDTTRIRVPFGIAQTGKAFRNEVTPRNFTFRSREFEQMEVEFFCHESQAMDWYVFWRDWRMEWWKSIGLGGDNLILREHATDELAHYSKATSDIEYRFPFTAPGFGELEGIAYRGNFDLTQHQKHSGAKLEYNDTERGELLPNGQHRGERYLPHVIEPSAGLDRGVLALLCEAYTKDPSRPSPEFMKFHPRIAPIKAAVFPLVNKDGMPEVAEKLHADLMKKFGRTGLIETDPKQSIGKRYARMDEAGCPFCFTIDGDTLKDQTVTVRDRDTGGQTRIAVDQAAAYLADRLGL